MNRWIKAMIQNKKWVLVATAVVTVAALAQLRSLSVVIDPDAVLPQSHPYVVTNNIIEKVFGNKYTVIIGVTAKNGDIFQPKILEVVQSLTRKLMDSPGIIRTNVVSLSARKSKSIEGNEEGMVVRPLMEKVPKTEAELNDLRKAIASNPVYDDLLISKDLKSTRIVAEFRKLEGGMKAVETAVRTVIASEPQDVAEVSIGGLPIFLALLEKYSERMAFLFPLAVFIIGLIHYEAFRTKQALILPLVTALLSVVWALGGLALMKQPLDVFNSSTPILILAIAAGHAVQILKRYYEEFGALKRMQSHESPLILNEMAVVNSMTKVGPVMVVACTIAALGFFSLLIFEMKSIRTFGIFTGLGIVSALALELTFIPALRSMLRAPNDNELEREQQKTIWDRIVGKFYVLSLNHRKSIYFASALIIGVLSLGGYWLKVENSQKSYFYGKIPERLDDDKLNERMAGTNPIYVLVDGKEEDAIKDPRILSGMEKVQRFLETEPFVGKTVSLVDFIKRMNRAMNGDRLNFSVIPESRDLIAQYLLLYSNSGEPGDFDSLVDYNYQRAVVQAFLKTDSSSLMNSIAQRVKDYSAEVFPEGVEISVGGGATGGAAITEVMIREKILNILQIMSAVFLVSALVFRSLLAGLLILVPLIAAVLMNFGVMGLLGIPLQIATALVSAMAVGIGADYGIYMSYRLREELATGDSEEVAIERAFRSAGKAALFVSSAVAGGFGVLMLSYGFMIHLWMGFLISLAMVVSSISALTIFPALIFTLRPRFIFGERNKQLMNNTRMSSRAILSILSGIALSLFVSTRASAENLSVDEVMKRNFVVQKVSDSIAESRFRLINSSGQERVRDTSGMTKLIPGTNDNQRLVVFLSPADVKGTKTLLIEHSGKDDDIWIYLPALKKVRRLVASNKKDSFVGTDFSYGDVIGHRVEDWNHKILREESVDGKMAYVVESMPKNSEVSENSGYSKRVSWILKENFVLVKGESYDLGGRLFKKFSASKIEEVDPKNKKFQPMVLQQENLDTGHKTILEFKNFKANQGVKEDVFTSRSLEKAL